jgi:hypothetical protein
LLPSWHAWNLTPPALRDGLSISGATSTTHSGFWSQPAVSPAQRPAFRVGRGKRSACAHMFRSERASTPENPCDLRVFRPPKSGGDSLFSVPPQFEIDLQAWDWRPAM